MRIRYTKIKESKLRVIRVEHHIVAHEHESKKHKHEREQNEYPLEADYTKQGKADSGGGELKLAEIR